jgi:hypothetical protein
VVDEIADSDRGGVASAETQKEKEEVDTYPGAKKENDWTSSNTF